jgi:microcystin-dependent protein
MANPFLAEIRIFPFNFPPKGWALCDGQLLPLSQNTALFSLLGTTYGGNGTSTFALPNLQGSVPLGQGQGPGTSQYDLGESGGAAAVALEASELPVHTHTLSASSNNATTGAPAANATLAVSSPGTYGPAQNLVQMAPLGNPAYPHNNMQPFLTLNFCIALQGVYPPRN